MKAISHCAISVVMPAYNAERTIRPAIESVLSQTLDNFELIVCDDASTDRTKEIVKSFADSRIRLIENSTNLGEGRSRDRAIDKARGEWIAVLDADDAFSPERLEALFDVAKAHPDQFIIDDIVDCHDTRSGLVPWRTVWNHRDIDGAMGPHEISFEQFMRMDRLLIKPLIKREWVVRYRASHGSKTNGADMAFFLCLFAHGMKLRHIPKPMYFYRMTPGSMSTANPDRHRLYREVFEEARSRFSGKPLALEAIDQRIVSLRRLETYQSFFSSVTHYHPVAAASVAIVHPWVVGEFILRCARRLPFYFHRKLHGGEKRIAR